jgi:hypothetical protein
MQELEGCVGWWTHMPCQWHPRSYPGIIDFAGKRELAYTFDHYFNGPDVEEVNKAVRVKRDFWVSLHRTTLLSTSHSLEFS